MEIFDSSLILPDHPSTTNWRYGKPPYYKVVELKGGYIDYPVRVDEATVLYDNPGRIPQYVKDKVEEFL